jgi:hypothetical protein
LSEKINFISDGSLLVIEAVDDPYNIIANYALITSDIINLFGGIPSDEIGHITIFIKSEASSTLSNIIKKTKNSS